MELVRTAPARHPQPPLPSSGLVVLHAAALEMTPRRMLGTLRRLGPGRVVLVGPEFGSLAHRLALDVGFDEVWPAGLPTATFQAMLGRAAGYARPARRPPTSARRCASVGSAAAAAAAAVARAAITAAGQRRPCRGHLHRVRPRHRDAGPVSAAARHPGRCVSAAARRSALAGTTLANGRRIDMTICRLRMAVQASGVDTLIVESVRGVGYRLAVRGRFIG